LLKLDKSFVRDIENDPNDAEICMATMALAHNLGLQVVAEGVETVEDLAVLRELECDVIQGYYLAKPAPANDIPGMINKHE
jgi:EAL domain-containing protein (putative c-di-GMP-specific phosphodiesterase class I)